MRSLDHRRPSLCLLAALPLLACGVGQVHRLPLSAVDARPTFPGLGACATASGLESLAHPDSVHVRFDPAVWLQFSAQGEQYNLVVAMSDAVPEAERAARFAAAKAKGDELYACSVKGGVPRAPAVAVEVPPASAVEVPPASAVEASPAAVPPPPPEACVVAKAMACTNDGQCPEGNCTLGFCQGKATGSACRIDAHCSSSNCSAGCCQTNDVGAACRLDAHCTSGNCTADRCQTNDVGAACRLDAHCSSSNCTGGTCQANTRGSPCRLDAHCGSGSCAGGTCQ